MSEIKWKDSDESLWSEYVTFEYLETMRFKSSRERDYFAKQYMGTWDNCTPEED